MPAYMPLTHTHTLTFGIQTQYTHIHTYTTHTHDRHTHTYTHTLYTIRANSCGIPLYTQTHTQRTNQVDVKGLPHSCYHKDVRPQTLGDQRNMVTTDTDGSIRTEDLAGRGHGKSGSCTNQSHRTQ